jgi:hypothetical protein
VILGFLSFGCRSFVMCKVNRIGLQQARNIRKNIIKNYLEFAYCDCHVDCIVTIFMSVCG